MIRSILFWLHLAAGVTAGSIILVMSVTGILLAYERQIVAFAERGDLATPEQVAGGKRVPLEQLVATVAQAEGKAPDSLTVRSNLHAPVVIGFGREKSFYLNPYSGELLGDGSATRKFFRTVTGIHRWLGSQEMGRKVTGACNLAFIVLIFTGMVLWCPRRWPWKWNWRSLKPGFLLDLALRGRGRHVNWHKVIGIWCAPVLIVITLTGTIWSYTWSHDLIYILSGSKVPPPRGGGPRGGEKPSPGLSPGIALDPFLATAQRHSPRWSMIQMRLPNGDAKQVSFTITEPLPTWEHLPARSSLSLEVATGEVAKWEPYHEQEMGPRIRAVMRPVHTGEAGGWIGQTLTALASIGGVILVWTGLMLTWRRFFRKRKAPEATPQEELAGR